MTTAETTTHYEDGYWDAENGLCARSLYIPMTDDEAAAYRKGYDDAEMGRPFNAPT